MLANREMSPDAAKIVHQKYANKEFAVRYFCVQDRYIRMSTIKKMEFLKKIITSIKSLSSLSSLINTMSNVSGKLEYYSKFTVYTNIVYDKLLLDHDRTLEKTTIAEVENDDIDWFTSLSDPKQITVTIGLLRLSGGAIVHEIYKDLKEVYENFTVSPQPLRKAESSKLFCLDADKSVEKLLGSDLPPKTLKSLRIGEESCKYIPKYDPNDPLTKEIERKRKKWNVMLENYRKQVERKTRKDNASAKSSKSGKSGKSKSTKSAKTNKSKKGKGKSKKIEGEVDWIQLLPVWIVKKIFAYLDKKTLKKAKTVNQYWTYVIADLLKEQKMRKQLNKLIRKTESSLNPDRICRKEMTISKNTLKSRANIRVKKLFERGAVHPKLKPRFPKRPRSSETKALIDKAFTGMEPFYRLPITKFLSFPRNVITDELLYEKPPCVLRDIGLKLHNEPVQVDLCEPTRHNSRLSSGNDLSTITKI